jgi:hypothetical protein
MKYVNIIFIGKDNQIDNLLNNKSNGKITKYTYKNVYGYNLKVNDLVIVRIYKTDFNIGYVTEIFDEKDFSKYSQFDNKNTVKEIIGTINVKKAKECIDNENKLKEYNEVIEKAYKQMSKLALLEQIAQKDASFKEMLTNYKKLLNKLSK